MRYYRRSDPGAVAYIEALIQRAAEMGVSIEQLRDPYAGRPAPNARTTPPFARVVGCAIGRAIVAADISPNVAARVCGITSQDYFYVAARRDIEGVAEALASLTNGIQVPEECGAGGSIEQQMRVFRATPADAEAFYQRLQRAAVLAGETIYDYAAATGA